MFECYRVHITYGGDTLRTITLRLEDELHKQLKLKTVMDETTMQDYITNLIIKDLEESKEKEK